MPFLRTFRCLLPVIVLLLTGCSSHARPAVAAPPSSQRRELRLMPLGDSITRGSGYGNYRRALQALLAQAHRSYQFVGTSTEQSFSYHGQDPEQNFTPYQPDHEGYGSIRIDQVAGNSPWTDDGGVVYPGLSQILAHDRPDVILLMLGTNDVLQNYDPPGEPGYDGQHGFAADAAGRLDILLNRLFQWRQSLTVVVAAIPPLQDPAKDALARAYNAWLPRIVTAHRHLHQNISFVSMHRSLTLSQLSPDGIHPRTVGYDQMARVWDQALTGRPAPPLPRLPPPAAGPGQIGEKNIFSHSVHVVVSNTLTPAFSGTNLVDRTNHAFVFADIHNEWVSLSGFHSAIGCLRFFDTPSYTGRTPGQVTIYYSTTDRTSLNPHDYIKRGRFTLPTLGGYPPPAVGDLYENPTVPPDHPNPTELKSQPSAVIDFDDLEQLALPPNTRSLLLDFSKSNNYGDGLTEIQAFPPASQTAVTR